MIIRCYIYSKIWYGKCFVKSCKFLLDEGFTEMIAYELFSFDEKDGYEFIGILPERRKDPKRITNESIVNWGRTVLGNRSEGKKILFNRIDMQDVTGSAFERNLPLK